MKKITSILVVLFLTLGWTSLFAYDVSVQGFIYDENGNAVDKHVVVLKAETTDPNVGYRNEVKTKDGQFEDRFSIPDGITGTLTITTKSCRGDVTQTLRFADNASDLTTRLAICLLNSRCAVSIDMMRTNAGIVLVANPTGVGPFKYEWSTGETTQRIQVRGEGEYCVKITDSNGCEAKACEKVGNTSRCGVEITVKRDSTTIVLVANAKGTAPFKYEWSNGETTETIKVDKNGQYCVVITDANGCQARACYTLVSNTRCDVKILARRANTGVILFAEASGEAPFTYEWSTGDTTQSINVEKPGEYCVKVTDANGCEAKTCFDYGITNDRCGVAIRVFKDRNGVYLWAQAKGTAPFKYEWSNGETTSRILVKPAGEYCVKITDANGCEAKACFNFDRDEECKVAIQITRDPNNPDVVKLTANTKGNGPFKYEWSNGETTESILAKNQGTYCVTIYSANGDCRDRACVRLPNGRGGSRWTDIRPFDDKNIGGLRIFPNPTDGILNIVIAGTDEASFTYVITNSHGKRMKEGRIENAQRTEISVADFMSGHYSLTVFGQQYHQSTSFFKK